VSRTPVTGMRKWHFAIAVAVVLLDRLSKWLVETRLDLHDTVNLIPGFFRVTHVQNKGAAFGLFAETTSEWRVTILVMFSVVALIVVAGLLWKNHHSMVTTGIGLSLILGGAVGNLWDRLVAGHVVDFLDFYVGTYHWPAFNVADSAIVSGALLLIAEILFAHTTDETPPLAEQ
jgi:signal peptidase II